MVQKGGVALIILFLVIVAGLSVGVYLVSQNTSWFSNAEKPQISISYPSASPTSTTADSEESYENPFVDTETYENPFNEL